MANLPDLLRCYVNLQKVRYAPEISKLTTAGGRITTTLRKFMSHGDVVDEPLLVDYDVFIRQDQLATDSEILWVFIETETPAKRAAASIKKLQYYSQIQKTLTAKLSPAVTPDLENECDMAIPTVLLH